MQLNKEIIIWLIVLLIGLVWISLVDGRLAIFVWVIILVSMVLTYLNVRAGSQEFNRGLSEYQRGNYQAAIEQFSRVIRRNRKAAYALNNRGQCYFALHEYSAALTDFNEALRLAPKMALAYLNRGNTYCQKYELDAALTDLNRAIALHSQLAVAYYSRGRVYWLQQKLALAIQDMSRAIGLHPENMTYYDARAKFHAYAGNAEAAVADFTYVLSQTTPTSDHYYNLGVIQYQQGAYQDTIDTLSRAIALKPNTVSAYYARGNAHLALGDRAGALAEYQQAVALPDPEPIYPQDEHGFYHRGLARVQMDDRLGALEDFKTARELCSRCMNQSLAQEIQQQLQVLA